MSTEKRKCKECGAEFEVSKWHPNHTYCSARCRNRANLRRDQQENPERISERKRRHYLAHMEKITEKVRRYRRENLEKVRDRERRCWTKRRAESIFSQLAQLQAIIKEKLNE